MSACYLLYFLNVFQDMNKEILNCSVAFIPMFTLSESTHTSYKRIFSLCMCIYMYSVTNCADFFFAYIAGSVGLQVIWGIQGIFLL